MFTQLPPVGLVRYNGYTLPPVFRASVRGRNVYDLANRAVKYVTWTFNISWEVTGGDAPSFSEGTQTDNNITQIKRCLMDPAGEFYFQSQGFGNFVANAGGVYDVANGPTPLDFSWDPIGSNRACRVTWVVEVHLPECCNVVPATTNQLMEWTFEVNYSEDKAGMTVRTVSGTLEIPIRGLVAGSVPPDIVDAYRERLNTLQPVPLGFARDQTFHVSRDKRTLDFNITDSEIPSDNPYPKGIVDADVRYSVTQVYSTVGSIEDAGLGSYLSNKLNRFLEKLPVAGGIHSFLRSIPVPMPLYVATMAGSYKVLSGQPVTVAYDAFQALVKDRRTQSRLGRALRELGLTAIAGIPSGFGFSEGIYDRTVSFTQSWYMPVIFEDLMKATGIWRKVPAPFDDWSTWRTSMTGAFGVRALAGMRSLPNDDVVVSLCLDDDAPMGGEGEARLRAHVIPTTQPPEDIPKKATWISHAMAFSFMERPRLVRHSFYHSVQAGSVTPGNTSDESGGFKFREQQKPVPDVIQQLGGESVMIRCSGGALRIGEKIPPPILQSVGGVPAIYAGGSFSCEAVSNVKTDGGTQPIYAASWSHVYVVDDVPQGEFWAGNNFVAGGGDSFTAQPTPLPWP